MKQLKKLVRRMILGHVADAQSYIDYLKKSGVSVGENLVIYSPETVTLDVSAPCLLSIGDHVVIARGVTVLTHDYAWSVLRRLPQNEGQILGAQSPVNIGNHVFIGMNTIIARGVTVGDHVVIGAGSVVTKDCEPNSVYAGNPAKKIMSIEAYCQKRKEKQFEEAKQLAVCYFERFQKRPPMEVFKEYFMLFATPQQAEENPVFNAQLLVGDKQKSMAFMQDHAPMFDGYEAFLNACFANQEDEVLL